LLLFNWFGYQLLSTWLQQKADTRLEQNFAQGNYNPQSLIELSVAVNLPYTTDWTEWENTEGNIEIDGILYRYVQRKMQDGRLYVRCLPHAEKQMVLSARDQFVKLSLSMESGTESKKGQSQKISISNFIGDYDDNMITTRFACPAPLVPGFSLVPAQALTEQYYTLITPPPELS
jgi:hypothetical protein